MFALFHDGMFCHIGLLKDAEAGLCCCASIAGVWAHRCMSTEQHWSHVSAKAAVRL